MSRRTRKTVKVLNNSTFELESDKFITVEEKQLFDYLRNYYFLNGEFPLMKAVFKHFQEMSPHTYRTRLAKLQSAGLLVSDPITRKFKFRNSVPGLCRMSFKGEILKDSVKQTKENRVSFYDVFNSFGNVCYRVMTDMEYKSIVHGDYIIVAETDEYVDGDDLLVSDETGNTVTICKYIERLHDNLVLDFKTNKFEKFKNNINVLGVVICIVRMQTQLDRVFLRSRLKVTGIKKEEVDTIFEMADPDELTGEEE